MVADDPQPQPLPPPPAPVVARTRLEVTSGLRRGGRMYVLRGQRVTLAGHVTPYVPGQTVQVQIAGPGRPPAVVRAAVRRAKGEGSFSAVFAPRRAATYTITAAGAKVGVHALDLRSAGPGMRGPGVALLKQGLDALGFPAGAGPSWTDKLGREVMAFRKANDMARTFTANRTVFRMVFARQGAFRLRHPDAGKHAEFDWSRQVLALAEGGRVVAVYHASSGKPSTPTRFGKFHFYLKAPGTNAKGMYDSNYFTGNYAVHGYPQVPPYAASHGCIRVPNADAPGIFRWVSLGDPIFVYV